MVDEKTQHRIAKAKETVKHNVSANRESTVNITFRLDEQILKKFRKTCQVTGVSMTKVLEEFMKVYAED